MNVLKTHCQLSFFKPIPPSFIRSHITMPVSYYKQEFAVHLMRQEIYLFPCLFFHFHVDAMQNPACLFWFMNKDAVGRNVFWCSLTAVILYSIPAVCTFLSRPFLKNTHFPRRPTFMLWQCLACEVAFGYSMALLIVNSQQFQLSLRPHCYWYKARN